MTVGGTFDERAQNPNSHGGKVLRLRDDGTAPADNPFVGRTGYKPEIFSLGHRNALGLTIHPETPPSKALEYPINEPAYGWQATRSPAHVHHPTFG